MATVVGPGDLGPWQEFRFNHMVTLRWCDGQERILEEGVDYPREMPLGVLRQRLKVMTSRQHGTARVWTDSDGRVHVIMTKDRY
jgi:hypothetical protein